MAKVEVFYYQDFDESGSRGNECYSESDVEQYVSESKRRMATRYPETTMRLYEALDKFPISNRTCVVIGSTCPYYEGIAIEHGAFVTLVEYEKIKSGHPKLKTMVVSEFDSQVEKFDVAISISSVEHSGLGRYGDPIDPDGDLLAMKSLRNGLNDGGLCFLAVPIGKDQILWNAHRVYGRVRHPLLVEGFEVVATFGLNETDWERGVDALPRSTALAKFCHQPVFVLRKQ